MEVLVAIVNYRTPELAIECLRSLEPEVSAVPGTEVVVVDNASADGSAARIGEAIRSNGWSWATLSASDENGGFAYGNNRAIAAALASSAPPRLVYLLNPDTLVLEGGVRELVSFMRSHPEVGIAGGRIVNPDGSVRNSTFRFHTALSDLEETVGLGPVSRLLRRWVVALPPPDAPAPVDWVSGASMIVRREVFADVGLLDEGYFLYFEETDFCLRAARRGWPCWYVPASRIVHLVGQSTGVTGARKALRRRPRYWFESRHRYFRRNHGVAVALAADVAWAGGYAVGQLLRVLRGRERKDPPLLLWDFLRYSVSSWLAGA